jgi:peptidoglycan L-alanyl-D-glutamate endopeptidase CwlK
MPLSAISLARLAPVHPKLASAIKQIDASAPDLDIQVSQGIRTWAQQEIDYEQGRTTPGKIITNARGGFSWHQYGLAVDLLPEDITPGQPDWDVNHPAWSRMVSLAESFGLVSGSEWHGLKDWPHVQLTGRFPVTPDDEVRAIYEQNHSIEDVWAASGI